MKIKKIDERLTNFVKYPESYTGRGATLLIDKKALFVTEEGKGGRAVLSSGHKTAVFSSSFG